MILETVMILFGLFYFYMMWLTGNYLLGIFGVGLYLLAFYFIELRLRVKRRIIRSLKTKIKVSKKTAKAISKKGGKGLKMKPKIKK